MRLPTACKSKRFSSLDLLDGLKHFKPGVLRAKNRNWRPPGRKYGNRWLVCLSSFVRAAVPSHLRYLRQATVGLDPSPGIASAVFESIRASSPEAPSSRLI